MIRFCLIVIYLQFLLCRMAPGFENAPYVGQNIKQQYSTKRKTPIPIKKAVENWFKEKNYFKSEWLSPFQFQSNPVIGHYTQLAWANTYKVVKIIKVHVSNIRLHK